MSLSNKRYTDEFKKDAVKLVIEHGYTIKEAARRLGCDKSTLVSWLKVFRSSNGASEEGLSVTELEAELKRLRKENKRLEMEREILKKAAAFFAKESQ